MLAGLVAFADVARHTGAMHVRCGRCHRRGRVSLRPLIPEHGPDAGAGHATANLNIDRENKSEAAYYARDLSPLSLQGWFL